MIGLPVCIWCHGPRYLPGSRRAAKGRLSPSGLQVFKCGPLESSDQPGARLEVWADMSGDTKESTEGASGKGVCLVLGGCGLNYMLAADLIDRIFLHKECVFYKHNPIKPMLAFPFEQIFMPLYYRGVFAQCFDHDLKGSHKELILHPAVKHIHITGKAESHDAILATLREGGRKQEISSSETNF